MFRLGLACGLFLTTSSLFAQEGPRVIHLTVSPAPKGTTPFPLWPHLRDLKPGNGAIFYERSQATEWWGQYIRKEVDKAAESLDSPWKSDPGRDGWLDNFGALKEIDYAARCETCDWQLTDRIRTDGFALLIPDMQSMRTLSAVNAARARAALHRGEYDKASRALQTSFVMSKHVGETPTLITYLVGAAIAGLTQDRLDEWIAQPDAPSLYWAITDLPSPLIDWRRPLQGEALMLDSFVPEVRQAMRDPKPPAIAPSVIRDRLKKFAQVLNIPGEPLQWSLVLVQLAGPAREHFAAKGLTPEELDRLPVTQLSLMYLLHQYDERMEEYVRLQNLSYWQARPFLVKLKAERKDRAASLGVINVWQPAFETVFLVRPRLERRFAMQRHVEALRIYAADHEGQWPDTLDDLRTLPLPVDPYTGKAFDYRREGERAILEAGPPPGQSAMHNTAIRYELTIRKKGDGR